MKSLHKVVLPLLAAAAFVGMLPAAVKADNPITRPRWQMPHAGQPGNAGVKCEPGAFDATNLAFGNCFSQNTLFMRLTGELDPLVAHPPHSMMAFAEELVRDKLLKSGATAGAATFATFLDLTLKRFLDDNTATSIDYDPVTYLYRPVTAPVGPYKPGDPGCVVDTMDPTKCSNRTVGQGGYEAAPLFDRTCIDIPLVGSVCMHGYLYDVDNEIGQVFFKYNYTNPQFSLRPQVNLDVESASMDTANLCTKIDPITGQNPCGALGNLPAQYRDDDDGLAVALTLNNVKLDLFFEPPTDSTLTDVLNDSANAAYDPALDLSTYLKAYGVAELGTVILNVAVRVAANYNNSVQPHTIGVGLELQSLALDTDFQFVFRKGPYCNNNLGTTESSAAGATYYPDDTQRPFTYAGASRYPGLVSDTTTNANPGARQISYFSRTNVAGYHYASNIAPTVPAGNYFGGGSGAGRDRIGVGTNPYEPYVAGVQRFSDNPNNCVKPADACDVSVAAAGGNATRQQQGGPEWDSTSGISSQCEYPNSSNNGDDATFKISEQITSIVPYLQGELKVAAIDKFKLRTRGNPGYYLGPTSLLDLGSTLAGLSFDWPLRPQTDYVFIDALLDSDVDQDSTNEFWADDWGVMMPFSFALGVSWVNDVRPFYGITSPTSRRLDLPGTNGVGSCVQQLKVVSGYRDGFGEFPTTIVDGQTQNKNDDPFLSKTRGNKIINLGGGTFTAEPYQGVLAGFGFPEVTTTGTPAAAFTVVPPGSAVGPYTDSYAFGLALHQNALTAALYDAVVKGLLCVDLDATGQYNAVTDQVLGTTISDLLNTKTFEMFFPALADKFPDRPMRVRVVPLLQKYKHNSACNGGVGNCGDAGMASFSVTSAVNKLPGLVLDAEAPYVIMGGPPIGLDLVTAGITPAWTGPAPTLTKYVYPDLTIVIPNLLIEFYVYGQTPTDNQWYRVFAVDMGVAIGLNIDIVKSPATFVNLTTPVTGQTFFPIGCDQRTVAQGGPSPGAPSYCSGGSAYTKRVLRLAGLADPEINAIIEYSELTYGQAGTSGTDAGGGQICGGSLTELPTEPGDTSCSGGLVGVSNAWTNPSVLKGAISNLIGLALSVDINALVEVGFDLGAFLNIPLAIDAPYIGPSYVATNAGTANISDGESTPNGFGDYLVAGVSFDLSNLSANYLIQQIDYLLDGTDSTKPFGIDGLDIGLAPSQVRHDAYIPVPQATIQPPVKVSAAETVFRFAGYDAKDGAQVRYSWRMDNGVWSSFSNNNEARVVGLLEGKHTIEAKAINSKNMMQDVPARYTFVVDSIAPKIRVVGDRTVGSRASFFVEASDWLTPKEDVRVAYRLDDGRWTNFGYNKKISLSGLREGRHTLRVRASDNAGNTAESAFNFSASDGGFGCSTAPGAGSLADVLVMLVIPALVFLRKRLF